MSGWGARYKIRHTASTRGTAHWFITGMVVVASLLDACGPDSTGDPRGTEFCTPDYTDRVCGDDGCSGNCGACAAGDLCDALGLCYDPATCIPDCAARGRSQAVDATALNISHGFIH